MVLRLGVRQQVEPAPLTMTDVALLMQPLQAGVVGVQPEGSVAERGSHSLERCTTDSSSSMWGGYERSGWVSLRDSKAKGWGALQDGRHGQLRGVDEQTRLPRRVPHAHHRRRRQRRFERVEQSARWSTCGSGSVMALSPR